GLQTGRLNAEDNPQLQRPTYQVKIGDRTREEAVVGNPGGAAEDFRKLVVNKGYDRTRELMASQDALVYMAEQTGGFAVLNTNDLSGGIARIADDARGYYLLGF